MRRALVFLQVVAVALLTWTVILGFSVLQGKATPGTHMRVALTAALVSILAHVLAVLWSPRRLAH